MLGGRVMLKNPKGGTKGHERVWHVPGLPR